MVMKILVTGNKGFIASKVCDRLTFEGHEVFGFDIIRNQDILNYESVSEAVRNYDVVLHLAAQANLYKMTSLDGAMEGTNLNVVGTHNIAHACSKWKKRLIYASTVCVYGEQLLHPVMEDLSLPNPAELYAFTKLAGELLIKGYGSNFELNYSILRFATIYGPGMRDALGCSVFFRQALKGDQITVHGDGSQERTLTYVEDLVDGIVSTINSTQSHGKTINLSSTDRISALRMATDIKNLTKSKSEIVFIEQRPNQVFKEDFSTENATDYLGWSAKTSWSTGLQKTYEWFTNKQSIHLIS